MFYFLFYYVFFFFFFQAEDGIRDHCVTGVQTCALPICQHAPGLPAQELELASVHIDPVKPHAQAVAVAGHKAVAGLYAEEIGFDVTPHLVLPYLARAQQADARVLVREACFGQSSRRSVGKRGLPKRAPNSAAEVRRAKEHRGVCKASQREVCVSDAQRQRRLRRRTFALRLRTAADRPRKCANDWRIACDRWTLRRGRNNRCGAGYLAK